MNGIVARLRAAGCVFAEDEAALLIEDADDDADLERMLARRVSGEPLEVVLGWAGFDGLRVAVARGVFVPRRRTELLVRTAASHLTAGDAVFDLCCGSGAIALALAARIPGLDLHAADVEPAAVRCARGNLDGVGEVHEGDLFDAIPAGSRFEVIVVNAPYVPSDEVVLMPREARASEPLVTLDGGRDGLDLHRRVAAGAPAYLTPRGILLIETSARQAASTAAIVEEAGMSSRVIRDADLDATVVLGRTT